MVAEAASKDHPDHQDCTLASDDGLAPGRQEDNLMIGEPSVGQTTEMQSTTTQDNPVLAICAPPSAQNISAPSVDPDVGSSYHLKWIPWNSGTIPIVMQSINGPCPLIAIMNVMLLREKIKLPNMLEQITESQLLAYIGESIMDSAPESEQDNEAFLLNLEQNIHDAIEILPKLKTGLDVNIRFTGITDFEYTPECTIFDLLRIPLYHGWLCDPELFELQRAINSQSYNQLVDDIITNKASQDPVVSTRVLLAEEFLEKTASQLTAHGLGELRSKIKDNEIGILFRNNHFLTLLKRDGEIYLLVTDHGYLTEDNIVWETLDSVEGAGRFFDGNFQLSEITNRQVSELKAIDERQQQMVNDYLIALSLNKEEAQNASEVSAASARQLELDDHEVAKKLQAEEDAYYQQVMQKQASSRGGSSSQQPVATTTVPGVAISESRGTVEAFQERSVSRSDGIRHGSERLSSIDDQVTRGTSPDSSRAGPAVGIATQGTGIVDQTRSSEQNHQNSPATQPVCQPELNQPPNSSETGQARPRRKHWFNWL